MKFFLVYLFLEIAVSVPSFSALGVFGTFAEIVSSAILGFVILTNSSYTMYRSFDALKNGLIGPATFQTLSHLTIFGAFLLIIPGILTDIVGLLMQFGFISTLLSKRLDKKEYKNTFHERRDDEENIIDVEVIDYSDVK